MATTPQHLELPPGCRTLYVCRRVTCPFVTVNPAEARQHFTKDGHPYDSVTLDKGFPRPTGVTVEHVGTAAGPNTGGGIVTLSSEAPPLESLDEKASILRRLFENAADVAAELREALEADPRTRGTGPIDDAHEMELHALTFVKLLKELEQHLAVIGPTTKGADHA